MEQYRLELWWHCAALDSYKVTLHSSVVNNLHSIILMSVHLSVEWDIGDQHLLRLLQLQQQRPMVGSMVAFDFLKHSILLVLFRKKSIYLGFSRNFTICRVFSIGKAQWMNVGHQSKNILAPMKKHCFIDKLPVIIL